MASFAISARLPYATVAISGLAFVVSDAMIGIDRFISSFADSVCAIWATYAVRYARFSAAFCCDGGAASHRRLIAEANLLLIDRVG